MIRLFAGNDLIYTFEFRRLSIKEEELSPESGTYLLGTSTLRIMSNRPGY